MAAAPLGHFETPTEELLVNLQKLISSVPDTTDLLVLHQHHATFAEIRGIAFELMSRSGRAYIDTLPKAPKKPSVLSLKDLGL